mmetsp:Transcript_55654/g.140822  ORF Transcript_55654/g.140822 Transcript_55654/m.140822 type:complete len:1112 (+) Transcript_55654:79-3414(+)
MSWPMVNDDMVEEDVLAGCPVNGQPVVRSQISSSAKLAPCTQMSSDLPHLSDLGHGIQGNQISCGFLPFIRTYSRGSTVVPDSAPQSPLISFQADPGSEEFLGTFSLDPDFGLAFSHAVSESNSEAGTHDMCALPSRLEEMDDLGSEVVSDANGISALGYLGQGRTQVEIPQDLPQDFSAIFNPKYPFYNTFDSEREIGCDAEGLLQFENIGHRFQRSHLEDLEDLLGEVKDLYNQKYPLDHVDLVGSEVQYDTDGLLWLKHEGQGVQTRDAEVEKLQHLLDDVKDLYNAKYPLDSVDVVDFEVGTDVDGLLWVQYSGDEIEARDTQVGDLEELLEEVKQLYNKKYPLDRVDDVGQEVGCDVGLDVQVAKMEQLEALLHDVKGLYNEKYPLDHVDDMGHQVGYDADGLLWIQYTGQGVQTQDARAAKLEHLLDEVKDLYNCKYPLDSVDDVEFEVGIDADGLQWVQYTGDGAEVRDTQLGDLEELLEEVKQLYNRKYPLDHVDDVGQEVGQDADGLLWVRHSGQGVQTQAAKIEQLEVLLEEVKGLYNERYPLDHADAVDHEVGCDADGLLWVQCTGHSAEAREMKMEELLDLLEEVKGLYNERYLLDHVDDSGCEVGRDADGLLWVQHFGQGVERMRGKADELQDLLQEVKILYNEKYPYDHVDDDERDVGRDTDGLLWVQYTGHGAQAREAKGEELLDLLEEVKGLYNEKFPLDHVDDVGCEMGHDAEGLLWVMHTGQGTRTRSTELAQLEDLLEEVKGLYNEKYPDDHVDDQEYEFGYDSEGLHWLKYTGTGATTWMMKVERLEDMLEEVKGLYNERYPQDNADDEDREVGTDADGLLWVRYTGQTEQTVSGSTGQRWATLCGRFLQMQQSRARETRQCKMDKLSDLLQEVKGLYNKKYPLDHVDDMGHEAGVDEDGLLWVSQTGQGSRTWAEKTEHLEDLLEEVKGLYNEKYPLDHVDDLNGEVGLDCTGLHWVRYTGHGGRCVGQMEKLQDLLQEVKGLYSAKYPLDNVDDAGCEVGYDADGLLWVKHTGLGIGAYEESQAEKTQPEEKSKMDKLQDMLNEAMRLYNTKYPLDNVDDVGHEVGYDVDGLLWVKYTGAGVEKEVVVA